ncbi:hypothetical protein BDF20DRAFT_916281 [Mycotypha africana]|uniref:uncharacterized protein n=1 Tax=Mycotypha africana TaxID=64632 RepID=UPI0022FFEC6F|nr:uncharacterized protein BDF20DRAFT_916281 [Mycotypha africana]KAI8970487.1 hypothetical protein BDF20DRAFT_916281 [Mycotypha africana]
MSQNVFRTSFRASVHTRELQNIFCKPKLAYFSSKKRATTANSSSWLKRFLTPAEERDLYFDITSSFRKKLVEQSEKSHQSYSNIIEHALLASNNKVAIQKIIPAHRLKDLQTEIDKAGKEKDIQKLQQLEEELLSESGLYNQQLITMYNRLIRAYLWSGNLQYAEGILTKIRNQDLLPTTRTFTYLIKAYLEANQLSKANNMAETMQHLSLLNLKRYHSFDVEVMLRYYIACGDKHAIDYLWRDMTPLIDMINPTLKVLTIYIDYLLSTATSGIDRTNENGIDMVSQVAQIVLHKYQKTETVSLEAFVTWLKATKILASQQHTRYTQQAEELLCYLIERAPSIQDSMSISKPAISIDNNYQKMITELINHIVQLYTTENQALKILAFYYKLRKVMARSVLPEELLDSKAIQTVKSTLQRVEEKSKYDSDSNSRQIITSLEGLITDV